MFPAFALSLALLNPAHSDQELVLFSPEDVLHQPFVELIDLQIYEEDSGSQLRVLRSRIQEERDRKIEELKQRESEWKKDLAACRDELEGLNKLSSEDTKTSAQRRAQLHIEIAALERSIREAAGERERTIPAAYDLQLTKLWLAQHWPKRRETIRVRIQEGEARTRQHGDADDIGYRRLVKDPEQDIATGQQTARQMAASGWLPFELQDNEVQTYVRRMAARLAANSDLKVPLRVTVLDSEELKAVAVPGGFLYVTSGVIRAARSESELAGVLSREVARIAARHAARSARGSLLSKVVVPVAQLAAGIFTAGAVTHPAAYYGIGYGVEGVSNLMVRQFNGTEEKFETEADQLGIQYAWKAGYDPRGFVGFLDSISEKASSFLNNEPRLQERMMKAFSEIQYLPPREELAESGEFERVRERLAR